jgi:predicted nucleic acid-binding protein
MILLDTNVVSELMKPSPAPSVKSWVLEQGARELFTTSITLAEILYGTERLPRGRREELLRSTAAEVFASLADHRLAVDSTAATHYPDVVAGLTV